MLRVDRILAGIGGSFTDTARGLKQRFDDGAAALENLIPGGEALSRASGLPTARSIRDQGQATIADAKRLDAPLKADPYGRAGGLLGSVAATAPLAALGPVGMGAASGFMQPTTDGAGEVATNMALGAGGGYLGDKVVRGVSRVVAPRVSDAVRGLLGEGITPTPGQLLGGVAARTEAKLTSAPIVGDAIAAAQRRAGEDVNRAAFNRALKPIGETLPKDMPLGRQAVQHVEDTLGARYDALLPNLTTRADGQLIAGIQNLRNMVGSGSIDPAKAAQFEAILQNQVLSKFQPGANNVPTITGQTMKGIESDLGQMTGNFRRSADPDQRMVGDALAEVQSLLRETVRRSNPQLAAELKAINTGWANFKRVQRAAGMLGADDGIFTPAQLQSAVKALDRSKDKGSFADGKALMQDLSDPAKAVLGSKYPDSGTAGRLMNVGTLASGAMNPAIPMGWLLALGCTPRRCRSSSLWRWRGGLRVPGCSQRNRGAVAARWPAGRQQRTADARSVVAVALLRQQVSPVPRRDGVLEPPAERAGDLRPDEPGPDRRRGGVDEEIELVAHGEPSRRQPKMPTASSAHTSASTTATTKPTASRGAPRRTRRLGSR